MPFDRKLITRLAAALLALPVLYVASSGPVLSFARRHSQLAPGSSFQIAIVTPRPEDKERWVPERFYPAARSFYAPLVQVAASTGLQKPLYAYLKAWDPNAQPFSFVWPTPGVHRRYYHPPPPSPPPVGGTVP